MDWLERFSEWITANSAILWWLSAASVVLFLVTPVIVAWLVTKLPTDYFSQKHRRPLGSFDHQPALRLTLLIAKSAAGVVLLMAGLVMLIAPGQGLLTVVVGLILLEFPGKYRVERWLVTRRQVWRSINWLRKRAGRPELNSPR